MSISVSCDGTICGSTGSVLSQTRQLRRLPHVFCKWVELPFGEEANVEVEESRESYKFVIRQAGLTAEDVVAEAVEIVPGAMKVRLRGEEKIRKKLKLREAAARDGGGGSWRARLPASTVLEVAASSYVDDVVTVTIPKSSPGRRQPPPPPPPPTHSGCDVKRSLVCLRQ